MEKLSCLKCKHMLEFKELKSKEIVFGGETEKSVILLLVVKCPNCGETREIALMQSKKNVDPKNKKIEIEVYQGIVSEVKNVPEGYDYEINDLDVNE